MSPPGLPSPARAPALSDLGSRPSPQGPQLPQTPEVQLSGHSLRPPSPETPASAGPERLYPGWVGVVGPTALPQVQTPAPGRAWARPSGAPSLPPLAPLGEGLRLTTLPGSLGLPAGLTWIPGWGAGRAPSHVDVHALLPGRAPSLCRPEPGIPDRGPHLCHHPFRDPHLDSDRLGPCPRPLNS